MFFCQETSMKLIAKRLVNLLEDMSLSDHPVLFHCFSNFGSLLYYYISLIMNNQSEPKVNLKGCVFDSAPAPRKITSGGFCYIFNLSEMFIFIIKLANNLVF